MLNLDPGKMAKNAVEGLQKAEKLGGGAGEAAKGVLEGIKKAEKLADLEKAPEQVIEVLRKLLAEAKQLANSSANKNEALDTCIQKAEALLSSDNISTEAVTKLTAELSALLKGTSAGTSQQPDSPKTAVHPTLSEPLPLLPPMCGRTPTQLGNARRSPLPQNPLKRPQASRSNSLMWTPAPITMTRCSGPYSRGSLPAPRRLPSVPTRNAPALRRSPSCGGPPGRLRPKAGITRSRMSRKTPIIINLRCGRQSAVLSLGRHSIPMSL